MSWDIPIWGPQNQSPMFDFCKKNTSLKGHSFLRHIHNMIRANCNENIYVFFFAWWVIDLITRILQLLTRLMDLWAAAVVLSAGWYCMIFHLLTKPEGLVTSQLFMSMAESSKGFVTFADFVWFCFSSVDDINPPTVNVDQWKIGFLFGFCMPIVLFSTQVIFSYMVPPP